MVGVYFDKDMLPCLPRVCPPLWILNCRGPSNPRKNSVLSQFRTVRTSLPTTSWRTSPTEVFFLLATCVNFVSVVVQEADTKDEDGASKKCAFVIDDDKAEMSDATPPQLF